MIRLKSPEEIDRMRRAGAVVAAVFEKIAPLMLPGVTTYEIDRVAHEEIERHGAIPSFLDYPGEFSPFPAATCISIDSEVVHGIPSQERFLEDGMIVSVDVGAYLDEMHGDAARTYLIGEVDPEIRKLVEETEKSFWKGFEQAKIGNRIGDISHAVEAHVKPFGFGVIEVLTGHGVGYDLHEDPSLPNFGRKGRGVRLAAGMTLALEPMITLGSPRVQLEQDGWTFVTRDGKPASHYENTFAITEQGPIILTA
ncbi:MAG: type I methionyl aminopeptidase [Saccharofermentanales bacterium]|jgi:methionyl aminopeptidase|nr:type I methionyl aminopeptidase [Eubacteriales bacterium]MDD3611065.1 type I methionyl aminopeptidase [Eubacteriales bacterium]HHU03572.1 type I methionyl aminopeptidase [Fastidiosipila sp.]